MIIFNEIKFNFFFILCACFKFVKYLMHTFYIFIFIKIYCKSYLQIAIFSHKNGLKCKFKAQ